MPLLNTDGLWTILFSIPLPLALNSAAVAQGHAPRAERVAMAAEASVDTAQSARTSRALSNARPSLRADQGTTTVRSGLKPRLDGAPRCGAKPHERGDNHACSVSAIAEPRIGDAAQKIDGYFPFARFRLDEIHFFDSQAPPRDSRAIASGTASKRLGRLPSSEFKRGTLPLGDPRFYAANLILLDYFATFGAQLASLFELRCGNGAESVLVPPNSRRPQRFPIEPLVLVQSS
jgi:hypothetical protein